MQPLALTYKSQQKLIITLLLVYNQCELLLCLKAKMIPQIKIHQDCLTSLIALVTYSTKIKNKRSS
jgi:hypothetical protein